MPAMAGPLRRLSPIIHRETVNVNVLPSVPHEEVKNVVLGRGPDEEHMAYIRDDVGDPFDATVDFVWSDGMPTFVVTSCDQDNSKNAISLIKEFLCYQQDDLDKLSKRYSDDMTDLDKVLLEAKEEAKEAKEVRVGQ